ncbi:unnamed protein product [Meloidogyne enterolobii]|uniref:Uncharacterized protein n=1 Tax=Meloidogyne enterolobii TaxID=390850 RepID=A0ACB0YUC1_MELEN
MSIKIHPKIVVDTGNERNEKNTKIQNDKSNENSNYCSNNASNSASLYFSTQHKQFRRSMAQDAEDGPDFLDVEQNGWDLNSPPYNNNTSRPPMNQDEFDKRFCYRTPRSSNILKERASALLRYYYRPCLSTRSLTIFFLNFFPILQWLPNYEWKNWFASDIIGGIVTGVMHVPQGIAYAQLAGVDAVVGLYTSFFPPLIYMFFGTSRHNSIGKINTVNALKKAHVLLFFNPLVGCASIRDCSSIRAFTVNLKQIFK